MNSTKQKIDEIIADMNFERRKPVSANRKQQIKQLLSSLDESMGKLNKLHLQLFNAVENNNYQSISPEEAKKELNDIIKELEGLV